MTTRKPVLLGLATLGAVAAAAWSEPVQLKLLPSGAARKIGSYSPQRLILTSERPAGITKAPEDLSAPLYGVLALGPREKAASVFLVLDEPAGKPARLLVDANANGDLTDDPAVTWTAQPYKGRDGADLLRHMGAITVKSPHPGAQSPLQFQAYRFDKADAGRIALKDSILFYPDYAYEGEATVGGKKYPVMLQDVAGTADFRGREVEAGKSRGVVLLIDLNGNGRFEPRGEQYDVGKPFNIGGVTYEVTGLNAAGGSFEIVESKQTVAEILPPPDLSPGKKAIVFEAKTTSGKALSFPSSYKGKVVLLDFWATWCGPCIAELPHLTAAYEKYHERGLEVLGISLDQENAAEKLAAFTKDRNMPWPQVYDGKFWKAAVAQLYGVESIPQAYLVDGDTGEILAAGAALRGGKLAGTIERVLDKKFKK